MKTLSRTVTMTKYAFQQKDILQNSIKNFQKKQEAV